MVRRLKKTKSLKKNKKIPKNQKVQKTDKQIAKFVMSRWDGTHIDSTCSFSSSDCLFNRGQNGILTGSEPDPRFPRILLGWPQRNGSLVLDDFIFRKVWNSCDPIVGRLGLETNFQSSNLHPVNLLKDIKYPIECAGGPYSTSELTDTAIIRMMKELYRSANIVDELPTFGDLNSTIDLYACHCNAYWGMFYCEFFRLFNFMLKHSKHLNNKSLGFQWQEKVMGTLGFLVADYAVKDTCFLKMADTVVELIDIIVGLTPCMLEPVGLQHMLLSNVKSIESEINSCAEYLNSKSCWLNKPVSLQHKVARNNWKIVRNIILNLQGAVFNATCIMSCFISLIEKAVGSGLQFDKNTIEAAMNDDPVLYGYHLRHAEFARNIIEGKHPGFGYTPFNFPKYAINLADRTKGLSVYDYMPPYVGLFTTLQLLQETEYCGNLYYESYLNAFGPRHTSTVLSVVERSKYEWLKYPINFPEDTSVLTFEGVTEYQPLLSIMLRIAKLKEGINETNSTTDLHLEEGKKELVFALWCTHIIDQCYDSKVRMTKKPRTIRVDEKYWKPYNSKQPINVSPEMILLKKRISLIAARVAKHKVIPKWYNLAIKKLDRERILNKGMSKLILIFKHFLLKKRKLAVITIKKAWYSYKKKMDKKANEIKKLEEEKFKQQEKEKLEQLKSKKKEKKKLEQVPTNICYRKANLNELRRRLEYYVIHNIFNDPYLLSFRRCDGSFPFHVFYTFPSLQPIIRGIGEPIEAIAEAANLSCQIEAFSHGIRPRIY